MTKSVNRTGRLLGLLAVLPALSSLAAAPAAATKVALFNNGAST